MAKRITFLLGISVFWVALSLLTDGINSLVLPARLQGFVPPSRLATTLGLLSFTGLMAGMLIQPLAGMLSDRLNFNSGRKGLLAAGAIMALVSLAVFGISADLTGLAAAYLLLQVSASTAQAAQQAFIPDLIPPGLRGSASGWKAFMDIAGSALGFAVLGQVLGSGRMSTALAITGGATLSALLLTLLLVRKKQGINAVEIPTQKLPVNHSKSILHDQAAFVRVVISRFLFLLGTYIVGRFLLLFVSSRLGLEADAAARQAGNLLAALALVTLLAAPFAGRASDRWGRAPVILTGSLLSATGAVWLIFGTSLGQMFAAGSLLSLGSAAFASANWALTADLVPAGKAARYFGLANFGTAGAAAAAGLFGPAVDWFNKALPGSGYPALFASAAGFFLLSALAVRRVKVPSPAIPAPGFQDVKDGGS